jgi:hypothetical protein
MLAAILTTASWVMLAGCATTQSAGGGEASSNLSPELQARYDACAAAIDRWCHEHAHGDVAHESQCRREARRDFARITDEAQRTRYLSDHGCPQQ